jgi:RHS repeat-associated protein
MKWTLINPAGTNDPDTGDIYSGLDRFGRVKDNRWLDGAGDDLDRLQYGYDRASNRIWRRNVVAAALGKEFDELYGYDAIHRLQHMARGTLNGGRTALTSETFAQCWTLDSTGNWQGFREDDTGNGTWDLVQQRSANPVNEISGISETAGPSWVTPAYSRAGNMTTLPQPADPTASYTATYDAWNRLVKLADGADTVSEYAYDGAKRRIVQKSYAGGVLDETRHLYYTEPSSWQVLEERVGTSPDSADADRQFVWGRRYIDDLVLRDRDTDANGSLDERLYTLQDANWNVTAIVDDDEDVQERYACSACGTPLYLSSVFVPQPAAFDWETIYCGYCYQLETGLFHVRNRVYSPKLGAWVQRDPIGYLASDENLYCYARSNPLTHTDPNGESVSRNISCGKDRNQCYGRCATDPDPSTCQATCDASFQLCMNPPLPPPLAPPPPVDRPPVKPPTLTPRDDEPGMPHAPRGVYCGQLQMKCCSGVYQWPVYGDSTTAALIVPGGSGCVTLTDPPRISCSGGCSAIKTWQAHGTPAVPLLSHEACHACAYEDSGGAAYWQTAVIDQCNANARPATPLW